MQRKLKVLPTPGTLSKSTNSSLKSVSPPKKSILSVRRSLVRVWSYVTVVDLSKGWAWGHTVSGEFSKRSIFSLSSHGTDESGWILTSISGFTICHLVEFFFSKYKMMSSSRVLSHAFMQARLCRTKILDGHTALVKFSTAPTENFTSICGFKHLKS